MSRTHDIFYFFYLFIYFFTQVQTPVTLCSGELWSILVVRLAHSADLRSRLRQVSSAPSSTKLTTSPLQTVKKCKMYTVCCIKNETTFVLENWHVTINEPLLFGAHWPPVVILFWWHQQKTEECTSIGCSAKFLRGVWNFSLYKFSDFLEKRFCHCSLSFQFFATKPFVYTPCYTHNQYFHLEDARAHLVRWHQRPSGAKVSNWGSSSVLSVVATAVGEWQWVCRVFLAQMEGPSFSKVLDIKSGLVYTFRPVSWLFYPSVVLWGSSKELPPFLLFVSVISHCLPYF